MKAETIIKTVNNITEKWIYEDLRDNPNCSDLCAYLIYFDGLPFPFGCELNNVSKNMNQIAIDMILRGCY